MSWTRRMKRKGQKEFAYEQYAAEKKKVLHDNKRREATKLLYKEWTDAVEHTVPRWIQILSLFIPPKWYLNLVERLLNKLTSLADPIIKKIHDNKKLPYWRKAANYQVIMWSLNIIAFLLKMWLLHIRQFVRTFGLSTKIKEHENFRFTMVVKYWFTIILETEVTV